MKIKILVLNSDSLAAVSVSDDRVSHGFRQTSNISTVHDMLQSSGYNRMLALPAMLAHQVSFALDDVYQVLCQAPGAPEDDPDSFHRRQGVPPSEDSRVRTAAEFMDSCDFYTLNEGSSLDCDYIRSHFDFIFFFLHARICPDLQLEESLKALLTRTGSPLFMLFNVQVDPNLLHELGSVAADDYDAACDRHGNAAFILDKLIPAAAATWVISPQAHGDADDRAVCQPSLFELSSESAINSASIDDFKKYYEKRAISCPQLREGLNSYLCFHRTSSSVSLNTTSALLQGWQRWFERQQPGYDINSGHGAAQTVAACEAAGSGGSGAKAASTEAGGSGLCRCPEYAQVRELADDIDDMAATFGPQGRPFTIAVSSQLLVRSLVFGISPWGASLLGRIRDLWPQARIVVFMGRNWYSWVRGFDQETIISGRYEQLCKRAFQGAVKGTAGGSRSGGDCGSAVLAALNQAVYDLIKTENFKSQEDLPSFPECLDGGWYNAAQDRRCRQYRQVIDACYLDFQYHDFAAMNIDLMISDSVFEQVMALGHGAACLGLNIDMDCNASMSAEDFAIFNAAALDFTDINLPVALSMYPELHARGMMRMFNAVGHYGPQMPATGSSGLFLPELSLRGVLEQGIGSELSRLCDSFDYTAVNVITDLMVRQSASLMVDMARALTAARGENAQPLLPLNFLDRERHLDDSEQQRAVELSARGSRIAQYSNYTSGLRYELQWYFLQYLTYINLAAAQSRDLCPEAQDADLSRVSAASLNRKGSLFVHDSRRILSFGCSRGQESCELLTVFNGQHVAGVDISDDAIACARQMLRNIALKNDSVSPVPEWLSKGLPHCQTFATEVEVHGCTGSMSFATSDEVNHLIETAKSKDSGSNNYSYKFDVVTAMTVLCRHPDTVGVSDCSSIYPFAEFTALVKHLDSLVKTGGLLCIFNANYALEDTELAGKYLRLFPFAPGTELKAMPEGIRPQQAGQDFLSSARAAAAAAAAVGDGVADGDSAADSGAGAIEFMLPEYLLTRLKKARPDEIHGYVSRFDSSSRLAPQADRGTIFLKIAD